MLENSFDPNKSFEPYKTSPGMDSPYAGAGGGGGSGVPIPFMSLLKKLWANKGKAAGATSALSSVFGGAAKSAGDSRNQQNMQQQDLNRALASLYGTQQGSILQSLLAQEGGAMNRYQTRQGATQTALGQQSTEGLQRAKLGLEAPSVRARQSIMGSLMKNMQPLSFQSPAGQKGHETTFTGGMSASALDPTTRQHGQELLKAALAAQVSGSDIPAATDFQSGILDAPGETDFKGGLIAPPKLAAPQGEGKLEKTLGGSSLIASILAALMAQQQQNTNSRNTPRGGGRQPQIEGWPEP